MIQPLNDGESMDGRVLTRIEQDIIGLSLSVGFDSMENPKLKDLRVVASCFLTSPYPILRERVSGSGEPVPWIRVKPKASDAIKSWLKIELASFEWSEIYDALHIAMYGKSIQLRNQEIKTMIKCMSTQI